MVILAAADGNGGAFQQPKVAVGKSASPNGIAQAAGGLKPTIVQTGEQSGIAVGTAARSTDVNIPSAIDVADIRSHSVQRSGNRRSRPGRSSLSCVGTGGHDAQE